MKMLNGQVNYTNVVASSTLLHETIHRQASGAKGSRNA
jgi:hypothetical protein